MTKKFITIVLCIFLSFANTQKVNATEECFEGISRSIFKFNLIVDDVILEPLAKGYNKLPKPIKVVLEISHRIFRPFSQYLILCYKET